MMNSGAPFTTMRTVFSSILLATKLLLSTDEKGIKVCCFWKNSLCCNLAGTSTWFPNKKLSIPISTGWSPLATYLRVLSSMSRRASVLRMITDSSKFLNYSLISGSLPWCSPSPAVKSLTSISASVRTPVLPVMISLSRPHYSRDSMFLTSKLAS